MKKKLVLILFFITALLYLLIEANIFSVIHGKVQGDFLSFYLAAIGFVNHGNIYDYNYLESLSSNLGISSRVFPYLYPPPMAIYLSPITKFGIKDAELLWFSLSTFFFLIIIIGSFRLASFQLNKGRAIPKKNLVIISSSLMLTLSMVIYRNFFLGQVNIFVLAFMVMSLLQVFSRKREVIGGFLLVPAVIIKVTPLIILLFFVMNKRYKAFYGVLIGLIIFLLPTIVTNDGLQAWKDFLNFSGNMSYGKTIPGLFPAASFANFSVAGFFARILNNEMQVKAMTIITLAFFGSYLLLKNKADNNNPMILLPYLIFMVIASPLTYIHHMIYLYPGMLLSLSVITDGEKLSKFLSFTIIVLMMTLSIHFSRIYKYYHIDFPLAQSINLYALILLFFFSLKIQTVYNGKNPS